MSLAGANAVPSCLDPVLAWSVVLFACLCIWGWPMEAACAIGGGMCVWPRFRSHSGSGRGGSGSHRNPRWSGRRSGFFAQRGGGNVDNRGNDDNQQGNSSDEMSSDSDGDSDEDNDEDSDLSIDENSSEAVADVAAATRKLSNQTFIPPSCRWLLDRVNMTKRVIDFLGDGGIEGTDSIDVERVTLNETNPYLPDSVANDMETQGTTLLKASMGAGKTHQLYECLQSLFTKNPDFTVLVIGFRKSLNSKYLRDFQLRRIDFEMYDDIGGFIRPENNKRVIVQINSLWKVRGKYDMVILDEVTYTTAMIFFFCKEKATEIMRTLITNIKGCDHLIAMDAFLDQAHIDFISELRTNNTELTHAKRSTKLILATGNRLKKAIRFCTTHAWQDKLIRKIKAKKKLFIVTNHKKFITETLEPLYEKLWENVEVLTVTADSAVVPAIEEFDRYDAVIISPTMVAGLSFDPPRYFDSTMVAVINGSASAEIVAQMCLRVRRTKTEKIFVQCTSFPSLRHKRWDRSSIEKWLRSYKGGYFGDWTMIDSHTEAIAKTPEMTLLFSQLRKRWQSANNIENRLAWCFREQQFTVNTNRLKTKQQMYFGDDAGECEVDDPDVEEDENTQLFGDILGARRTKENTVERLRNAPSITAVEFRQLLVQTRRSSEDEFKFLRYMIETYTETDLIDFEDYELEVLSKKKHIQLLRFNRDRKRTFSPSDIPPNTFKFAKGRHNAYQRGVPSNPLSLIYEERDSGWAQMIACKFLFAIQLLFIDKLDLEDIDVELRPGFEDSLAVDFDGVGDEASMPASVENDSPYCMEIENDDLWDLVKHFVDGQDGKHIKLLKMLSGTVFEGFEIGKRYERMRDTMQAVNNILFSINRALVVKRFGVDKIPYYRVVTHLEKQIQRSYRKLGIHDNEQPNEDSEKTRLRGCESRREFCKF